MYETFRLKVAARRQVTLPQNLLDSLCLAEGDVLEISVLGNNVVSGRGLKLVPTNLFTPDILAQLQEREEKLAKGLTLDARNTEELLSRLGKTVPSSHSREAEGILKERRVAEPVG